MRPVSIAMFSLVLLFSVTRQARADETSHHAAVSELLDIMGLEKVLDSTIDQMLDAQSAQNPALSQARPVLQKFFRKYMSWASLKPDMIDLYQKTFTEKEVREMIAFYKTPTGRKTVEQLPNLTRAGGAIGMRRVQEHQGELVQMLSEAQGKEPPTTLDSQSKPAKPQKPAK